MIVRFMTFANNEDIWYLERLTVTIPRQIVKGVVFDETTITFAVDRWLGVAMTDHRT